MNDKALRKNSAAKDTEPMTKIIIVNVEGVRCKKLPKKTEPEKSAHSSDGK
jgi:hypothetical protein